MASTPATETVFFDMLEVLTGSLGIKCGGDGGIGIYADELIRNGVEIYGGGVGKEGEVASWDG